MSHYTVGIFTTNQPTDDMIGEILAPYWEGDGRQTDANPYFEAYDATEEYMNRYLTESVKKCKTPDGKLYYPWEIKKQDDVINDYEEVNVPLVNLYATFEDFMREHMGYELNEDGRYIYYSNPNAKWDWYQIGGRWDSELLAKLEKDETAQLWVNSYPVKYIDFEEMRKRRLEDLTPYHDAVYDGFLNPEYMLKRYPTEEEYIRSNTQFITYAVVTPDREWLEPGAMGWFGISAATIDAEREWDNSYPEFLEKYKHCWLTIVDCHI